LKEKVERGNKGIRRRKFRGQEENGEEGKGRWKGE